MSLLKGVCSQFWGALCSGDSFCPECPVKYFSNSSAMQDRTLSISRSLFLSIGNLRVLKCVFSPCSCGLTEALKSVSFVACLLLVVNQDCPQMHAMAVSGLILPHGAGHGVGTGTVVLVGKDRKAHLPRMCCLHNPSSSLRGGWGARQEPPIVGTGLLGCL